jgi:hypothetical protein
MTPTEETKSLPKKTLRFSKRMVALSLMLVAGGIVLMTSAWSHALMAGLSCATLGFGLLFTAGYYWGCDNESCS